MIHEYVLQDSNKFKKLRFINKLMLVLSITSNLSGF